MERRERQTGGLEACLITLKFFELDGSVKQGEEFGDPYRRTPPGSIAVTQFNDGEPTEELFREAKLLVEEGHCHPNSPAAKVYHAHVLGRQTDLAWPASFYWR